MTAPIQRFEPFLPDQSFEDGAEIVVDMRLAEEGEWCWYDDYRREVAELMGMIAAERWSSRIAFASGAAFGAAIMKVVYLLVLGLQ